MNAGKALAFLTALVMPVALVVMLFAHSAAAGTQTYSSQGYDLTQATSWNASDGHCSDPCHIPLVNFTSSFAATMNTKAGMMHYWSPMLSGQYVVSPALAPAVGQVVGVICWTTSTNLGVVDKIDARFSVSTDGHVQPPISGSNLWIGYEDDDYVNLTYADRVNYVPHC